MERGVYFDAWFPGQHNYHPSMPPRRLRMVEHLEEYRATMLCWSSLGGGVISLPYLEEEAFGEVPPRYRVYGFLNDREFIEECGRRGINVFGIVFEHGWEYPVLLNEDESGVLAWNETREVPGARRDWLGMREFWQDRYPKLWKPRAHYFPDGVRNADGVEVDDILEECAQRDIHGEPCRALWVECPDREHYNYMMDRNNPVWREYLKAIVRIQVDAGVQGVQFDETEVPITSLQYGGCFCETCVRGFREYLQGLDEPPEEVAGEDLSSFHYGEWLLQRGYDFKDKQHESPLFWDYLRFQRRNIARYFAELADYTREYARSRGREVLVSGNFFNLFDHYYPMEPYVDVIVTEMRNTTYRQPAWFRYAAGFGGAKPVVVVENPYGGVVPELVAELKRGRAYDRFRQSVYEAAAMGVNMTIPYGSWMGSEIQDAFYAPHELCLEVTAFLAEHERLFSQRTWSEVGVIFSIESNFRLVASRDLMQDNRQNVRGEGSIPFWEACEALSDAAQPYDVVFFPEGELRQDTLEPDDLARYRVLVAPTCEYLTDRQASLLESYVRGGGRLVVVGTFGRNLEAERREAILSRAEVPEGPFELTALGDGPQVVAEGESDVALNIVRTDDGAAAVHLIRYDYDEEADRVPPLDRLVLEVRLPEAFSRAAALSPVAAFGVALSAAGGRHRLELADLPVYGVVLLEP